MLKMVRLFFRKDISTYIPKLLQKDKKVSQMLKKLKAYYSKREIVDYFKTIEGSSCIFLSEDEDLFLQGRKLNSFDDWLSIILNLMLFSNAQKAYDNYIVKTMNREQQLSHAGELKKSRKLSKEQYLYLIEIINCRTDIKAGKA